MYFASKAYVLSFSEALREELASRGVRVTTLCPGSVTSEFQARAGIKPGLEHEILNISALDVAQAGYRELMANKRTVLPVTMHRPTPASALVAQQHYFRRILSMVFPRASSSTSLSR